MQKFSAGKVHPNLNRLIDQVAQSHQPITIVGRRHKSVLVSAEDWHAIQETLFLLSVPGMRESIKEGMAESLGNLANKLDWSSGTKQ